VQQLQTFVIDWLRLSASSSINQICSPHLRILLIATLRPQAIMQWTSSLLGFEMQVRRLTMRHAKRYLARDVLLLCRGSSTIDQTHKTHSKYIQTFSDRRGIQLLLLSILPGGAPPQYNPCKPSKTISIGGSLPRAQALNFAYWTNCI
jgi:hypothetical protein